MRHLLTAVSLTLATLFTANALMNPVFGWDAWAYHLPFAAYLWAIGGGETHFVMDPYIHSMYVGFPKLAEWLQGLGWMITGSLRGAIIPNIIILGLWIAHAKKYLRLTLTYLLPAIFAFPLITVHYQSFYIDFFTALTLALQLGAALALLRVIRLRATTAVKQSWVCNTVVFCVGGIMAGGSKYFAFPIAEAMVAYMVGIILYTRLYRPCLPIRYYRITVLVMLACIPVISLQEIHNTIYYYNPIYPYSWSLGGFTAPGTDSVGYHTAVRLADYLPVSPLSKPLFFIASVTEIDWLIRNISMFQYSLDMNIYNHFLRTGGLFGPYVLLHLIMLGTLAFQIRHVRGYNRRQVCWSYLLLFLVLTALVISLSHSYELRYYLIWPVALVVCNGLLLHAIRPDWQLISQYVVCAMCILDNTMLPIDPMPLKLHYTDLSQKAFRGSISPELLRKVESPSDTGCLDASYYPMHFRYSPAIIGGNHTVKQMSLPSTCQSVFTPKLTQVHGIVQPWLDSRKTMD